MSELGITQMFLIVLEFLNNHTIPNLNKRNLVILHKEHHLGVVL